jgi:hypothetical protein
MPERCLQEENDHVGEQNGQRTGHEMHLGNQVCGDDPSGLKKQAEEAVLPMLYEI